MGNQVVSKSNMTISLQTADIEGVHLMGSDTRRVLAPKVSTPRDTPLTHGLVPERLQRVLPIVELRETDHFKKHVDDWLCVKTRNGRATNVVNFHDNIPKGYPNSLGLGFVATRPRFVVRHDANDHA
jgi:hypothetical protein